MGSNHENAAHGMTGERTGRNENVNARGRNPLVVPNEVQPQEGGRAYIVGGWFGLGHGAIAAVGQLLGIETASQVKAKQQVMTMDRTG